MKKKNIKKHLGFLGYTIVSIEDDGIYARKPGYPLLCTHETNHGRVIRGVYSFNDNAAQDITGFLEYINELNLHSSVATFLKGDDFLGFYAHYIGEYERTKFAQFVQAYENDLTILLDSRRRSQFYLTEDCPQIDNNYLSLQTNEQFQA